MEFQIHWLAKTIWCSKGYGLKLWDDWFEKSLGNMIPSGHGGRGFQHLYKALAEAKIYADPIGQATQENPYLHLELTGNACDALEPDLLRKFLIHIKEEKKCRVSRLDLAWDGVDFTPLDAKQAVDAGQIRSGINRKSLTYTVEPYASKEDGSLGTTSLRLGSLSSERLMRIYDKRGLVRVELQTRAKRAEKVAWDVLVQPIPDWPELAKSHLRDYIDFENDGIPLPWWQEFIDTTSRARLTVTDAREKELERLTDWLMKQVAPSYSAVIDVIGENMMDAMLQYGRKYRGGRFDSILQRSQKENFE
jgi:DNA relaxase NicK